MARENLPSMLEDRQGVRLDDYIEDDLTRIYVYEQQTVKNEFITLYSQGVTFIVMARASAIPTIDKDGNHYFEALAEITQSGELQAVNKNELGNTKFVNSKTARLLTNGFKNKLTDGPKLYTIGKPFDYNEYMNGNQGVYVATISPTGMFSKQDLIEDKIIDAANLLEDVELTQMTLNNLLAIEKSVAASRLVILPYAGNLEDPRVDVLKGKYAIKKWDETRVANGLENKPLNQVLPVLSDFPLLQNNRDTVSLAPIYSGTTEQQTVYPIVIDYNTMIGSDVYAISRQNGRIFKNGIEIQLNLPQHHGIHDVVGVEEHNGVTSDMCKYKTALIITNNAMLPSTPGEKFTAILDFDTQTPKSVPLDFSYTSQQSSVEAINFRLISTTLDSTTNKYDMSIACDIASGYKSTGIAVFGIDKFTHDFYRPTISSPRRILSTTVKYNQNTNDYISAISVIQSDQQVLPKGNISNIIVYDFKTQVSHSDEFDNQIVWKVTFGNNTDKLYAYQQTETQVIIRSYNIDPTTLELINGKLINNSLNTLAQTYQDVMLLHFKVWDNTTDDTVQFFINDNSNSCFVGKNTLANHIRFNQISYAIGYNPNTDIITSYADNYKKLVFTPNALTTKEVVGIYIVRKVNDITNAILVKTYTYSDLKSTATAWNSFTADMTKTRLEELVNIIKTDKDVLNNMLTGKYPLLVSTTTDRGYPTIELNNNVAPNYLVSKLRQAAQVPNTIVEYKFNIVIPAVNPVSTTDPIDPSNIWTKVGNNPTLYYPVDIVWNSVASELVNNISVVGSKDTISYDANTLDTFTNVIQYYLKNQPGFKVQVSSQALLSAMTVTALQNNIRQDLQMNTDIDFVPVMIRVIDDRDRVEIQVPWFDTSVTAPIYKVKPFMKNEGATLKELFTVGSDTEKETDITCLWDMITITKLVREKFKTIPVEANNEIGHLNTFCSSTTNFSTQAFKGGTAAQLNDSIYEAWRLDNNLSHDDERVKQMRQIIALLSLYIASPDAIAGGTNRFNQVCQPYYLQGLEGLLTVEDAKATGEHGAGARWTAKPIATPAKGTTAAITKDIKEWKLILKSEYFNINNGNILAKSISDLTKTVFKTGDAKIELPVLPTTVSKQNALTKASDFEQKSSDGVSHIVYLPINTIDAFNLLYLEKETTAVNKAMPQSFNVTLPDTFHHELTQDELDTKLAEYMWKRYGVKPKEADPENGYSVTRPFTKSVIATERVFQQFTDQGKRGWPKWLEDGCENFYRGNDVYLMGDITHRLGNAGYSVAERIALGAHQSGNKNPYYTHHDHPDEWYLPHIVKNYYGEYKDVDLTDIKILNYNAAAQAGDLEIFYNENLIEKDERWWHLKFTFTVPVVKYADAVVEFKGKFSDYSDNVRGSVFTKSEFYELLATLNMSNDYFYDEPLHELTFWTNNKIDYIEAVDLTALFVDEINIVINGYVIPVPALNRETPTITYQKIILP